MGDIKLFKLTNAGVSELKSKSVTLEKSLQTLIERNLEELLGVRFLATEYSTGKTHGGRIDTMGIDENGCPVIIEYKRSRDENVINQGLYYFDWLLDHKAEFKLLVQDKFDKKLSEEIEWSSPRLICIAGEFTKFDEYAVKQINRNIELVQYRKYSDDFLLLELVNATEGKSLIETSEKAKSGNYKTFSDYLKSADEELTNRYETLKDLLLTLGEDVQEKTLKYYVAFKRLRNFCCVEVHPKTRNIVIYLNLDPTTIELKNGFTEDVTNTGHYGTGNLKVILKNEEDIRKAEHLIVQSYENS